MYILVAIWEKLTAMMVKYSICVFIIVFFGFLGPVNICLDTKTFFLRELETGIMKHVYSGDHLKKMATTRGKFAYL